MSWRETTLGEITNLKRGFDLPKSQRLQGDVPVYSSSGITGSNSTAAVEGPCVITGRYGTIGEVFFSSGPCWPLNTALYSTEFNGNNPRFVYYLLQTIPWQGYTTASAVPGVNRNHVNLCPVKIPDRATQDTIVEVLDSIVDKIALNNRINDYLEQLLMTSQRKISEVEALTSVRADEAFDIHIGKTPPRKESEWFSPNSNNNVVWMSIKDMGCGDVYLMDSSEYLTQKAVAKHNMKLCKPGSVLLSFKLTIGRVGIVSKEMTTNEAIACFSSDDPRKLAYLYPLLKSYDYASLGSTSSIATAVNSKMIKSMLLRMPSTSVLDQFYEQTKPLYEMLQNKVKENVSLTALRDVLLPKLMSGEIDVSKVDLTQLTNNHLSDC